MKIALGCDHRGRMAIDELLPHLRAEGHDLVDVGDPNEGPCDYPDRAWKVANLVASGEADRGILVCGTGIGMCIAANKVRGVRAALAPDELSAELSRSHNDANVLCMSGDLLGQTLLRRIVSAWMATPFEGGRHARRVEMINQIDRGVVPGSDSD
ncbi:MAG: ribose 5-phosphate isomerase B [Phycisphaerales bacterium]|nr:ribose 5-phosphate isomerase B [Phycisphaerales bacterium]